MIRRNAALLPAYSFVLGLIALLGYMAIAAGVDKDPALCRGLRPLRPELRGAGAVPDSFQSWFVGVAFAASPSARWCPAAIMSIACANLFTRNLYKEFLRPDCTDARGGAAWPRSCRWS